MVERNVGAVVVRNGDEVRASCRSATACDA